MICQGKRTAADYTLHFNTVAAVSGRNKHAIMTLFEKGLQQDIQKELACRDDKLSLDEPTCIDRKSAAQGKSVQASGKRGE